MTKKPIASIERATVSDLPRLVVHQFDPRCPVQGGIDTCLRGMIKSTPETFWAGFIGVDAAGSYPRLGTWYREPVGDRMINFMPLTRLFHGSQKRRVPHSARLAASLALRAPKLPTDVIVQTHRLDIGLACSLLLPGRPRVQFIHDNSAHVATRDSDSFWRYFPRGYFAAEARALRTAFDCVVFSGTGSARLRDRFDHVRFTPSWFDDAVFFPATDDVAGDLRILWVGRLEAPKHPELAVETLAALREATPEVTMTMIGQGTLHDNVVLRARELGVEDALRMTGAVSASEVADAMRSHSILLATSRTEGFPTMIVESLACGLPVVATREADAGNLISTSNGRRAKTRDPLELAHLCLEVGRGDFEGCERHVREFTVQEVVSHVLDPTSRRYATLAVAA